MKFNAKIAQYALLNNLHVEYFIWCYLRTLNDTGLHNFDFLNNKKINRSAFLRKLKTNIFFKVEGEKIFLNSEKKLVGLSGKTNYYADFQTLSMFANKLAHHSGNPIKGWNNTTVKYLLISIFASQYENIRPYALELIEKDLCVGISTIQRALKVFGVSRDHKLQEKYSPRSYYFQGKLLCFSPNYYKMTYGEMRNSV